MFSIQRMIRFDGDGSLKAFCDVRVSDALVIRGVRVIEGKHGLFVSMPRQADKLGRWFSVVEVDSKTAAKELASVVLAEYGDLQAINADEVINT